MPKYRKKPKIIDAFQMTKERRQDNSEWPDWLHEAWNKPRGAVGAVYPRQMIEDSDLLIRTLEGVMEVSWDDYIIRGIQSEIYACKPDIFTESYESVDDYQTGEIAELGLPEEGEPVPDSLPTTKRLLEKPHGEVGFEVVGNKIVERYDVPESITGEPSCQGLSDVARARNPEMAKKLCGFLNLGREKLSFLEHLAKSECSCDHSVGMAPCLRCEAEHLINATRRLSDG